MASITNRIYFIKYLLIIFIFCLSAPTGLVAQTEEQIEVRRFNTESIEQYQNDDAFFYLNEESRTDYKALFFSWINKMLSYIIGNKASLFLLDNLHYLLIIFAVILILYKMSNIGFSSNSFRLKTKKYSDGFDEIEHVEKVDFVRLIRDALKNKDYRLAIRYQYLNMLKKLSVSGFIEHSPHKTNVEYIYELKDVKLRDSFRQLAFIFDYVWYGENRLNSNSYSDFQPSFSRFEDVLINISKPTKDKTGI